MPVDGCAVCVCVCVCVWAVKGFLVGVFAEKQKENIIGKYRWLDHKYLMGFYWWLIVQRN